MDQKTTPVEVQRYLEGIDYPASKEKLIQTAQDNDASQDVFETLNNLPDREYESPTEVSMEIGKE
jgi:hypothetical protein